MKNKNDFIKALLQGFTIPLSPKALNKAIPLFYSKLMSAGDFIVSNGDYCDFIFYAKDSATRCYTEDAEGNETTEWIESPAMFLTDLKTFFTHEKSQCNIHLYQDSEVICIKKKDLDALCAEFHEWSLILNDILSKYLLRTYEILDLFVRNDVADNYQLFEERFPDLLKIVPLKHIASRLNISPVSLSRIRKNNKKSNNITVLFSL
ncbi:Crp/Fnr family transcriptional regulator [Riemerella columbina]|uniref:Crp/Fnr family transcriptional regulator n=1 Tax=Riemerella columbina TaxID=103810 RepID=UPI0026705020|nr:Crp/Fnr family transcriptional regulator [Riemerella columbina]WKS94974.1 Crp/Fnr family transcriptional regulator [Riemerella columbina]